MNNSEKVLVGVSVAVVGGVGVYLYVKRSKSSASPSSTGSVYSPSSSVGSNSVNSTTSSSASNSSAASTSTAASSAASVKTYNWTQIGYDFSSWTVPSVYLPSAYNSSSEMVIGPGIGNHPNGVYYLTSYFSSSSGTANLSFMVDDAAVVYLDGNKVASSYGCSLCTGVPVTARVTLISGTHLIAVQVANNAGALGGEGYVTYNSGTPNPTALRLSITQGSLTLLSTASVGNWKMLAYPTTLLSPNPMNSIGRTIPQPSTPNSSNTSTSTTASSASAASNKIYDQQISNQLATNQIATDSTSSQFASMTSSQKASFEHDVQSSLNQSGQAESTSSAVQQDLQIASQDAQQVSNTGQYGTIAEGQTVLAGQSGKSYYITNRNGVYYKSLVPNAISPGTKTVSVTAAAGTSSLNTVVSSTYTTPSSTSSSNTASTNTASTSNSSSTSDSTTRVQTYISGYKTEQIQTGVKTETVQNGYKTETTQVPHVVNHATFHPGHWVVTSHYDGGLKSHGYWSAGTYGAPYYNTTEYTTETKQVPVYITKTVPVYTTKQIPIYSIRTI